MRLHPNDPIAGVIKQLCLYARNPRCMGVRGPWTENTSLAFLGRKTTHYWGDSRSTPPANLAVVHLTGFKWFVALGHPSAMPILEGAALKNCWRIS